jgi:hypothetical protein
MTTRPDYETAPEMKLTVVCAWCGTLLRPGGEYVSHSICTACMRAMELEISAVAHSS